MLRDALSRYTSSPPAGGAVSLRLVSVAVPQAELRFLTSPGGQFTTKPLLRSPQRGSQGQFAAERSTVRVPMLSGSLCLPVGHFQTFMPLEKCTITGLK